MCIMKRFLTHICLILTAAVACTKEPDTYTYPELPDAYWELFDSYSEGKVIDLIGQRFGIYTISFTDNTRISVSTLDLPINGVCLHV